MIPVTYSFVCRRYVSTNSGVITTKVQVTGVTGVAFRFRLKGLRLRVHNRV